MSYTQHCLRAPPIILDVTRANIDLKAQCSINPHDGLIDSKIMFLDPILQSALFCDLLQSMIVVLYTLICWKISKRMSIK